MSKNQNIGSLNIGSFSDTLIISKIPALANGEREVFTEILGLGFFMYRIFYYLKFYSRSLFTVSERELYNFLYSAGDMPFRSLNFRIKYDTYSNPHFDATSDTESFPCRRYFCA